MKLNKFLVILVVIVVCIGCVAFVGCKKKTGPSGENYPVVQDTSKVNVYIASEVITTQQEFDQNGTFTKYSCEYDEIKDAAEGLLTFFDNKDIDYSYDGRKFDSVESLELTVSEEMDYYRIVVFTTVQKDQVTTSEAKILKYGNYTLVNTNKAPYELSFEEGCLLLIAKVKIA